VVAEGKTTALRACGSVAALTAIYRLDGRQQRCNNRRPNWRAMPMRTVAIEEHFSVPALAGRIDKDVIARRGYRPRKLRADMPNPLALLPDIGEQRLKSMDDAGITVQVLSPSGPGPDLVPGAAGVAIASEMNDHLAKAITAHPDRFAGFASLPLQSPDAAAKELARAVKELRFVGGIVNGTTDGKFLDHPSYHGLLAAAEQLDVPIYIHPHIPPEAVRQAYFSDLPEGAGRVLETAGWGWHSETAIHVLRMVVAGTLDRHPRLKLIIGHMGEMLPMMLDRADQVFSADVDHLKRSVSQTVLDQVWITTSGIFNEPPLLAALLTFGIDRVMFSIDYPYSTNAMGRDYLNRLSLAPADMAKFVHGNADALLKLKV
jgi:predicted TIM-barrel fold metal-dependent hydrolase